MAFSVEPSPVIDEPLRPRAIWYWIGGVLIAAAIAGAIAGFVLGFMGLDDSIDGFERVPYPDGGTISVDEPGDYVIYGEKRTSNTVASVDAFIDLVDPDGEAVVTSQYVGGLNYDFSGRSGVAIATFTADSAGSYEFLAADDPTSATTELAVGESIAGDLVRAILLPMAIAGIGVITGLVILIVTGVRRSRAKRQRNPPPPPGAWGQAPQTWGATPAPQTPSVTTPPPPPPANPNPPPPPGWPT